MSNSILLVLENIYHDIKKNYNSFNENNLTKAIAQFQINVLESRKKDIETNFYLNKLSLNDILKSIKDFNLEILTPPKTKAKLVPLVNALIIQSGKESIFLQKIKSELSSNANHGSRKKKPPINSDSTQYEDLRKTWLTSENLDGLETKLLKKNMNEIRAIIAPWNLKGRSKKDLIGAILQYIKRLRGLSEFGT